MLSGPRIMFPWNVQVSPAIIGIHVQQCLLLMKVVLIGYGDPVNINEGETAWALIQSNS
jgi:hypothetical protein